MSDFTTVTCNNCGDDFKTLDGAKATDSGYCSPRCHTDGEGLA